MARTITKPGLDLGIVTNNGDAMLEFYRDVVGLEYEATMRLEAVGSTGWTACAATTAC